jgi:hypothetical protein
MFGEWQKCGQVWGRCFLPGADELLGRLPDALKLGIVRGEGMRETIVVHPHVSHDGIIQRSIE